MFLFDRISQYIHSDFLPKNPVILDVGAGVGSDSIKMNRIWPQGRIYAFEPNPKSYPYLKLNTARFAAIIPFDLALGNQVGVSQFYVSNDQGGFDSSLFVPSSMQNFTSPVHVYVTTLDSWARENYVSKVDFLLLDMQGGEGAMLLSSSEIIKTVKIIQMKFFSDYESYKDIALFCDIKIFLENIGFFLLYKESGSNGNSIFVKK